MFTGASGATGEVRVGGRVASGLRDWSASVDGEHWTIRAALADANPVYLDGPQAKELRLHLGKRIWRWRDVHLHHDGTTAVIEAIGAFEHL
jgi:hypothetical protein